MLTTVIGLTECSRLIDLNSMPVNIQRWQSITIIRIAKITGSEQKQSPTCNPHPKVFFMDWMNCQMSRVGAITFKPSGKCLTSIHYTEKLSIVNYLFVFVGRRCGSGNITIRRVLKKIYKDLVRFTSQ